MDLSNVYEGWRDRLEEWMDWGGGNKLGWMGLSPAGLRTALSGLPLTEAQSKEGGVRREGHIIEGRDPISLLE